MGARGKNRIDEELVSVDSLVHCLSSHADQDEIKIVREQNDPPDFWMEIAGLRYAVEVTSIVEDYAYDARCAELRTSIVKALGGDYHIDGTFALEIGGKPLIPNRRSMEWSQLIEKAVNIIRKEVLEPCGEGVSLIYENPARYVKLIKTFKKGSAIEIPGPVTLKWEGEARDTLLMLMQDAVNKKIKKLNSIQSKFQSNIILVFYDAFGYCRRNDVKVVFQSIEGSEFFHSVFWAESFTDRENKLFPGNPGRIGYFLCSRRSEWMGSRGRECGER